MNETWIQILTIIVGNFSIILWFRKESREDWVRCQNSIDSHQRDTKVTIDAIQSEMKDFHKKLLEIEMGRKS